MLSMSGYRKAGVVDVRCESCSLFRYKQRNIVVHPTLLSYYNPADSQLEDIKNWDSLSALRVMNAVERASTIKIPLYQFLKAKSVRDIAGLLKLEAL